MLAEHGELLGQVAVQARQLLKARLAEDALLEPALKGVGAAPGQLDVQAVPGGHQRVADLAQLRQQGAVGGVDAGGDLDHALRHLRRHHAGEGLALQQFEQVVGAAGQVVVVGVDQLQFQLHPQGEGLRGLEGFQWHGGSVRSGALGGGQVGFARRHQAALGDPWPQQLLQHHHRGQGREGGHAGSKPCKRFCSSNRMAKADIGVSASPVSHPLRR
jgi:hypothetical protein